MDEVGQGAQEQGRSLDVRGCVGEDGVWVGERGGLGGCGRSVGGWVRGDLGRMGEFGQGIRWRVW